MSKNKLFFVICILFSFILLGIFIYKGLERQQEIQTAQDRLEYIGKRKKDCYDIFEREKNRESESHFTVDSVEYYEPSSNPYESKKYNDSCVIKYDYIVGNGDGTKRIESEFKYF